MTTFLMIHMLTSTPPACLNRDGTGMPKTCTVGGVTRGRLSSQCWSRAVRISETFRDRVQSENAIRTRQIGRVVRDHLRETGEENGAKITAIARIVAALTGAVEPLPKPPVKGRGRKPAADGGDESAAEAETATAQKDMIAGIEAAAEHGAIPVDTEQLVFLSPAEIEEAKLLAEKLAQAPDLDKAAAALTPADVFKTAPHAADLALWGRMVADAPIHNVRAALQRNHAFTVTEARAEVDYLAALDDLGGVENGGHAGAAYLDDRGHRFLSGIFYRYMCFDMGLLIANLGGEPARGFATIVAAAAVEAAATVAPAGKQSSYAAHNAASYVLAQRTDETPMDLHVAFLRNERPNDPMGHAVLRLRQARDRFAAAYGRVCEEAEMDLTAGEGGGDLAGVLAFIREAS